MVEMNEVSNILNNSTKNSLIVLDEIGRGTSTYDGLSIAWAVTEYISNKSMIGAKTLFATHYHELTELENKLDGVKNYKVVVHEKESGSITFLRKIVRGEADRSYGIEVAKLAGVRQEVIDRACEILEDLEERDEHKEIRVTMKSHEPKRNISQIHNENKIELPQAELIEKETLEENQTPLELLAQGDHSYGSVELIDKPDKLMETIEENIGDYKESIQVLDEFKEIIDKIKSLDMITLTPLDTMNILYELQTKVKKIKD